MTVLLRLSALAVALGLLAPLASAQPSRSSTPAVTLTADAGAPASSAVRAGGADRVPIPGSGCAGFIANATPSAAVAWSGDGPLSIYAVSGDDTTLLVSDPDGRWHCSDDARGVDPAVSIARPKAGTYVVWVGTQAPGETAGATLHARKGAPAW